jgi:Domain of unknown function (DUF4185)
MLRLAVPLASLWLVTLSPASAAENAAPPAPVRVGTSDKVCQLTGDVDWETGRPTAARTMTNFGMEAVDLGFPVEHDGKLYFLFGDTRPAGHGGGPEGEVPPDDSVGFTTRRAPPGNDGKCLELQLNDQAGTAKKTLAPPTIVGPTRIKQGWFNVPSGGVSVNGGLYAFFWTNHCTGPSQLAASPAAPLARPPASEACSENDDRNSVGRNVLARSDDGGRTFHDVVSMPIGFVYAIAVNPAEYADLPQDQRGGILVFAIPRYRASVPYLALAPTATFADPSTWRYFVGRTDDGQPEWIAQAAWTKGAGDGGRSEAWRPAGKADIFALEAGPGGCVGEFSVTWNSPLRLWLMLYTCRGIGVMARVAPAPWGPWSPAGALLGPGDNVACHILMSQDGCGNRQDFWRGRPHVGRVVAGSTYAPFVLNRYTTAASGPPGASTIYWLISTWNPYEVTLMRSTLRVDLH